MQEQGIKKDFSDSALAFLYPTNDLPISPLALRLIQIWSR